MLPAGVHVVPVWVKVDPVGYLSLPETSVVDEIPGCLFTDSSMASSTGVEIALVQLAALGQLVSPPPVTGTVLTLGLTADAATLTGTVITILPVAAPVSMEHPLKLAAPIVVQPSSVPPVAVAAALVKMPVGKLSFNVIGAVVGPLATAIVME